MLFISYKIKLFILKWSSLVISPINRRRRKREDKTSRHHYQGALSSLIKLLHSLEEVKFYFYFLLTSCVMLGKQIVVLRT